jgi:hypothetical protein
VARIDVPQWQFKVLSCPCGGLVIAMETCWKKSYTAALREGDPEKIPALCDLARRAIHDRMLELAADRCTVTHEREMLYESLRQLFLLERNSCPAGQEMRFTGTLTPPGFTPEVGKANSRF